MKKFSALAIALLLGIGLFGCSHTDSDNDSMMEEDTGVVEDDSAMIEEDAVTPDDAAMMEKGVQTETDAE